MYRKRAEMAEKDRQSKERYIEKSRDDKMQMQMK